MESSDIKALRTFLGKTQEAFAWMIGVSWTTVSNWESGKVKPSPLALARLERYVEQFERKKEHDAEIAKIVKGMRETARILERDPARKAVITIIDDDDPPDPFASLKGKGSR